MGPIVSLFVTSLGQVIDWLLAIQKKSTHNRTLSKLPGPPNFEIAGYHNNIF